MREFTRTQSDPTLSVNQNFSSICLSKSLKNNSSCLCPTLCRHLASSCLWFGAIIQKLDPDPAWRQQQGGYANSWRSEVTEWFNVGAEGRRSPSSWTGMKGLSSELPRNEAACKVLCPRPTLLPSPTTYSSGALPTVHTYPRGIDSDKTPFVSGMWSFRHLIPDKFPLPFLPRRPAIPCLKTSTLILF